MRKNRVKKTLAAGILALMTCSSMSAMAEPQWVLVGVPSLYWKGNYAIFDRPLVSPNMDVGCNKWLNFAIEHENWIVPYKTVPDKHWAQNSSGSKTGDLSCYMLDQALEHGIWRDPKSPTAAGTLSCKERQVLLPDNATQTIVCYEYREPQPCDVGYKLGRNFHGVVACNNQGYREVCAWMDGVINPEARDIVHSCIERHEYLHIEYEYWKVYDNECFEGILANFSETQRYEQEYAANGDSVVCLMRGKKEQCSTSACRDEMDGYIESIERDMNDYASEYCKVTGNVSSNIITCH